MEKKNFYITTTLPYVNASPHIGFALEIIQADIIARYRRALGDEVFFSTGTDEHGQKIFDAAAKAGEPVESYVDRYAAEFQKLKDALNLSNDTFIRTTDAGHIKAAQEMWQRCAAAGDIYKKAYEGLYCVGCEKFLTEKDLVDGKCPLHGKEPELLKEENYFFRFSKYQEPLLLYLAKPNSILPDWRREEAIAFVKGGLEDFSISREVSRLSWGVPVPGDETQVMYVWFDALVNYISTLGWPGDADGTFKKFWEEGTTLQVAGKDQVRFQSLMWQAMLISAGVKNTDRVFYHGFVNIGGEKMSKSLGNVVNPLDIVARYGVDALRYWVAREASTFEDSSFTEEQFKDAYNGNLANGIGNLASRTVKMAANAGLALDPSSPIIPEIADCRAKYAAAFEGLDIQIAAHAAWEAIAACDRFVQATEPFKTIKTDPEKAKRDLSSLLVSVDAVAELITPFMPETSSHIVSALRNPAAGLAPLFPRLG